MSSIRRTSTCRYRNRKLSSSPFATAVTKWFVRLAREVRIACRPALHQAVTDRLQGVGLPGAHRAVEEGGLYDLPGLSTTAERRGD
jgi:hypothetical protein